MRFFKKDSGGATSPKDTTKDTTSPPRKKANYNNNNVIDHHKQHEHQYIHGNHNKHQVYHWQSEGGKKSTVDDMVLLTKITEAAITDNLKKRLLEDNIYTYIGPVLVAVNPFKNLPYFGDKEVEMYQGAAHYEVPPHIYALADTMYRNMLIDNDSQCVIISGESGAGKTVSAKFIMNYITKISGGGQKVQRIKDIILESNPLLEAFGNAKTIRNNNSSRFGKYIEIQFSRGGEPVGGRISNFLLEKSRVHSLNEHERNFHIFYQLCAGAPAEWKQELGVERPDNFQFLSQSGVYKVDGTNDAHDFQETLQAMSVMGIQNTTQLDMFRVVAAILHMSNIDFNEQGNAAVITDPQYLEFPAYLLGIDAQRLGHKMISRVFDSKWGGKSERVDVTLNLEQAQFTRDAWCKGLYTRLFDYIVETVNKAFNTDSKEINVGILDIYGFEIFGRNGFEQFCINYVNEKLQQIFIELTLKSEQEEYQSEGIQWTPINFFNNKIVCDLIESKRPPGIMCILDDTCATMSAKSEGADEDFRRKMDSQVGSNPHYQPFKDGFMIKHYAGHVSYHIDSFCEKNRDILFQDIIELMQSSNNTFIRSLFPDVIQTGSKSRPTTAGTKIKTQANELVTTLMQCVPHYIRCIKPNETKKPHDWDDQMAKHQVEYLGLKENIKVKRAGFAYRRPFQKFLHRYAILSNDTWPSWHGDPVQGIHIIMNTINMDPTQYQIGKSKVFVKDPESLYMLEECRERRFDFYARVIQQAFKKHFSKKRLLKERTEASNLLLNRKERRRNSLNRNFAGDYIGVEYKPGLSTLIPRREKVEFALQVDKFDRRFRKAKRDLIVTKTNLYLIGREQEKKGPDKGKWNQVIKRKIDLENVTQVTMSPYQDDIILLHIRNDYESLLDVRLKTEFIMVLNRRLKDRCHRELPLNFINSFEYRVKKTGWGGGGVRKVQFLEGPGEEAELQSASTQLTVRIARGLPNTTRPGLRPVADALTRQAAQQIRSTPSQPHMRGGPQMGNGHLGQQRNNPNQQFPQRGPAPRGPAPRGPAPRGPAPSLSPPGPPTGMPPSPRSQFGGGGHPGSSSPRPRGPAPTPGAASRSRAPAPMQPAPGPPTGMPPSPRTHFEGSSTPQLPGLRGSGRGRGTIVPPVAPPPQPMNMPPVRNQQAKFGARPTISNPSVPRMGVAMNMPPPPPSDPAPANQPSIGTRAPVVKPPINRPKPNIPQVKALYGYDASDSDELTFSEGTIMQLIQEDGSGWWTCKHQGKQGFAPANYLQKL